MSTTEAEAMIEVPVYTTVHTPFRNVAAPLKATCDSCGWSFKSRKQGSVTAAAKRHVDGRPGHRVTTWRWQAKETYARPWEARDDQRRRGKP